MDAQYLASVIDGTLNPSKSIRDAAESALGTVFTTHGCTTLFLGLLTPGVDKKYRQSIGINIKNNIRHIWIQKAPTEASPTPFWLSDAEKTEFKEKLLDILLAEQDDSVRSIIGEVLRTIAEMDFPRTKEDPNNWPDLVTKLVAALSSDNFITIYNSLYLYRKLVKNLQYKKAENREVLDYFVSESFPIIQARLGQCVMMNEPEVAHILRISMKIFYSAIMFSLPTGTQPNLAHPIIDYNLWFEVMRAILEKKLPEASEGEEPAGQPTDPDERKQWHWWKLKKWCSRILLHFQNRYGLVTNVSKDIEPIAEYFQSAYLENFLKSCMQLLLEKSQGAYLTDEVFRNCVATVTNCVEISSLFKSLIKGNIDFLLFQVVFPTLLLNEADMEAFTDEPALFIRNMECSPEDWVDPRSSCVNLLEKICTHRQKYALPVVLDRIQSIITEYSAADVASKNYQLKDGAMNVISLLLTTFKRSKDYKELVEPFIIHHIVPELQSPVNFLRFRACWAIELFPRKAIKTPGVATQVAQALVTLLQSDPEIVTQAKAATAIQNMMAYEEVRTFFKPHVKLLVGEYFRVMAAVENDNILSALQSIVEVYSDTISDIAVDMTASLAQIFVKYFTEDSKDDDDDDYSALYASETAQTINFILASICSTGEDATPNYAVLSALEAYICPLIRLIMDNGDTNDKSYEFADNACDFVFYLTNHSKTLSAETWECIGSTMRAFNSWAFDFGSEMFVPILSALRRDMLTFLKQDGFSTLFFEMVQKLVTYQCQFGNYEMEWNLAQELLLTFVVESKPFPQTHYIFTDPADPFANVEAIISQDPETLDNPKAKEDIDYEIRHYLSSAAELTALQPQIVQTYFPIILDSIFPFILDQRHPNATNEQGQVVAQPVRLSTKIRALDLILSMLYVDAPQTLALLLGSGRIEPFFNCLFENFVRMERSMSERAIVMGLSNVISIVAANPTGYPPVITENLLNLVRHVIRQNVLIITSENEDEEYEDSASEDSEEAQDEGFDEDENAVDENQEEYRKKLEITEAEVNAEVGEPVDDEDELGEDAWPSNLFRIDPAVYFVDMMAGLPAEVLQSIQQALASEDGAAAEDSNFNLFNQMTGSNDARKFKILSRFIYKV